MNLFQAGSFTLHSGGESRWKIDCDALTAYDLEALALMLVEVLPPFGSVYGIPTGGTRIAFQMKRHITVGPRLIVDDVLTTGASMEMARMTSSMAVQGAVLFARGPCPDWIVPLFRMPPRRSE